MRIHRVLSMLATGVTTRYAVGSMLIALLTGCELNPLPIPEDAGCADAENLCPPEPIPDAGCDCPHPCVGGSCLLDVPNGSSCNMDSECLSGHCIDYQCCDTACDGVCQSCQATIKGGGDNGICGFVKSGTDPYGECNGVCDGQGMCVKGPAGESCADSSACVTGYCVDGVCCVQDSCMAPNSCTGTVCAAYTGVCTDIPRVCPGGGMCSDGNCPGQCTGAIGLSGEPLVYPPNLGGKAGQSTDLVLGDMDGDGLADLVTKLYQPDSGIFGAEHSYIDVQRNLGNGTFGPILDWPDEFGGQILLSDMNADGTLDIVLTENETDAITLLINDGSAGWSSTVKLPKDASILYSVEKVVFADLNNDGYRDILLKGDKFDNVYASLNMGATMLSPLIDTAVLPTQADDFDAADLDGDGRADLVVTSNTTDTIKVRMGKGDGSFGSPTSYMAVGAVNSVGLADVDADGDIDVIASSGANTMVRFNNGNGSFSSAAIYSGGSARTVDINGDGRLDIVGSTTLFNSGNGLFVPQSMDYMPLDGSSFGDFTGDGLVDIARVYQGYAMQFLRNQGNGLFLRPYSEFSPKFDSAEHVVFVDLNGDGLVDVATLDVPTNMVKVHLNAGNGNFAMPVDYPTFIQYSTSISSSDMNGDGKLDLLVSAQEKLTVHLNLGGGVFAPGVSQICKSCYILSDFNGDGYSDALQLGSYDLAITFGQSDGLLSTTVKTSKLKSSGYKGLEPVDLNGDGFNDLVVRGGTENLEVYLNDGTGRMIPQHQPDGLFWWSIENVLVDDINGDGYPDITFSGFGDASFTFGQVCLNDGHGIFRKGSGAPYGFSALVDVDGNGVRDWIRGMCVFGKCYPSTGGKIFVVDIEGDGIPELITSGGELHKIVCIP